MAVAIRERAPTGAVIDPFLDRVEELVDHSEGKVRGDVVHGLLVALGFGCDERSTPPRGRGGEGGVARRSSSPLSSLGIRTWDVVAVRLG